VTHPIKVKMTLEMTEESNQHLESLAEELGVSTSEVLRKALALITVASDAKKNSRTLGVLDNDDTVLSHIIGI